MALTDRQKKGIGYLVSAGILGLGGAVLLIFTSTPIWVPVVIDVAVAVAAVMGISVISKPEV